MATRSARRTGPGTKTAIAITRGGANVFGDLGLANSEERLAKSRLAILIRLAIEERGLTQHDAGQLMGIDQPKVSHILHGRLSGYSTQRLIEFLNALGRDVEIVVRAAPKSRKRGRLHIAAA